MRLGVLDVGSNTVHLLVVDAHPGACPLPAHSHKAELRLAELLETDGSIGDGGVDRLIAVVRDALQAAEDKGVEDLLPFATSAVREATNADDVLARVRDETGVGLQVLTGAEEARLTFLAVRRWFGWSAGRLSVFDIGGGSLEIAGGADESPDVAWSVPLGAARLAREYFARGRPDEDDLKKLRRKIRAEIARDAGQLLRAGRPDRAAATSKTFRSLARICGAAAAGEGVLVPRSLTLKDLSYWIPLLVSMGGDELSVLPGVSQSRSHQIVPGALVAEACMDIFDLDELEICPWALREGVILERIDKIGLVESAVTGGSPDRDA
jgi:exopolyphosphatase / guanosine-5'-triphosphate,3'-diphosphate pyrophosphatase